MDDCGSAREARKLADIKGKLLHTKNRVILAMFGSIWNPLLQANIQTTCGMKDRLLGIQSIGSPMPSDMQCVVVLQAYAATTASQTKSWDIIAPTIATSNGRCHEWRHGMVRVN